MKLLVTLSVAVLSLALVTQDAEAARRMGGGKSVGMQRESIGANKPATPPASPAQNQATQQAPMQSAAAAPAAAAQKRSWMGPLAGLAAGLGLAALAAHFGFGEALANALMIGLLVMAVVVVVGLVMRRRAQTQRPALAGAGAAWAVGPAEPQQSQAQTAYQPQQATHYASSQPVAGSTSASSIALPADFDVDGFVRQAKVSFLRLQAAHDSANLDDIREFTTPEMFGEIKMSLLERTHGKQETDVVGLNAEVLDVVQETSHHVVSVRFTGTARLDRGSETENIDEIWHIVKPVDGSRGWLLAGIQQLQ